MCSSDLIRQSGWIQIEEEWYLLDAEGVMQTGWVKNTEGQWQYLSADGVRQSGWVQDGNSWYYMDVNGMMQTGWVKVALDWYYMDADGRMIAGTKREIDGVVYTFAADGHLLQ